MSRVLKAAALVCISLAACQGGTDVSGIGGLAFGATTAIVSPPAQNFLVTATITNVSTNSIGVTYSGCVVTPVLHSTSIDGPVVYDPGHDPLATQSCATPETTKQLDPDQSLQVTGGGSPNLPAGKYWVEAVVTVNGESTSVAAGTLTF